jgi:hypothetical protein
VISAAFLSLLLAGATQSPQEPGSWFLPIQQFIEVLLYSRETQIVGGVLAFVIWIAGIVYCDRVADEQGWNEWVARIAGILLPVVGPAFYWFRRARFRAKEKIGHRPRQF